MKRITVVDYGLGNLFNLATALRVVGADVRVTDDPREIEAASRLVIPGVGAFQAGMEVLRAKSLDTAINSYQLSKRPLLGICLGMQLLMTVSEEHGTHGGFNFIRGRVVKFSPEVNGKLTCKVPQIAWNSLLPNKSSLIPWNESVLRDVPAETPVYFVHSYCVKTDSSEETIAYSEYGGERYSSVVGKENCLGVQFHPERSAAEGLKILANFLKI